jgi:putative protease
MLKKSSKPELVVAAGGWESLSAALSAGADAVYFGLKQFNLRINAKSFELSELPKIVAYCKEYNAKAYLALNAIFYDSELQTLAKIIKKAKDAGISAIICWDLAVIHEAIKQKMPFHISTQASVSNSNAVKHYADLGAKRVVLARECTLDMITEIIKKIKRNHIPMAVETFVHGAMCVSYSGRCFMSEYLFNRSANRGDCIQPCRRQYHIKDVEEGTELVVEDGFVLSPKDLCTVQIIDQLIESGINAFKIEGRTRPPEYIFTVTNVYRKAIDHYFKGELDELRKSTFLEELKKVYNRGFSTGFFMGKPQSDLSGVSGSVSTEKKEYLGDITHYFQRIDVAELFLRNGDLSKGDTLLITGKTTGAQRMTIKDLEVNHEKLDRAKKGTSVAFKINFRVRKNDKVFHILSTE